jgi:hypothetical protein
MVLFNDQAPMYERSVVISFETLSRAYGRLKACRFNRLEKGLGNCRVDLQAVDVKSVDAVANLDPFVRAMIAGVWLVPGALVISCSGDRSGAIKFEVQHLPRVRCAHAKEKNVSTASA